MLALWLDSTSPQEKERLLKLIEANFGSPRRTMWMEGDSDVLKPSLGKIEADATAALKEFFAQAQEDSEVITNEVLTG